MVAKVDYSQKIVKPIFWNNICLTSILQKSYHKSFTAEHAENAEVSKSDVFSAISAVYFLTP